MSSMLNIAGTRANKAILLRKIVFGVPVIVAFVSALIVLGIIGLITSKYAPALTLLALGMFAAHAIHLFIAQRLENDLLPLPSGSGVADYLSADLIRVMHGKKEIGAGDLLSSAIATKRGRFIIDEMGISMTEIMSSCGKEVDEKIDIAAFLKYAVERLPEMNETRIDANVILYLLFLHVESCTKLLYQADLSAEDLQGLLRWEGFHHRFRVSESALDPDAIKRNASMGRSWVMGYTDALDSLTSEVSTSEHATGEKSVIIHGEAIDNVMRVFARGKQRNILIMGKVGVGKRQLIENIAINLRAQERARHQPFTRVLMLHTERLLSGVGAPDTFLLKALSRAQKSGHFVLVIRDLALLLKSANSNLRAVLMKCLESGNMSIIGVVDIQDYHSSIKTDTVLDSLFEKVPVEDASDEDTMTVLMAHYFALERAHVRITYKALKSIVELSKRYLGSKGGFPGKAIDVMDDAILRAAESGHSYVNEDHVRDVISLKGRVNVSKLGATEKERLIRLEEKMRSRIIDQDAAVKSVVSALKRARMDLSDRKRPIGTFLFLGPTGVGKTQTAKVLAEEYFGSADAIIRLDMNEYSQPDSIASIIGSGASGEGFLAQRVQDKPFSLILLDEIEKAHPSVLNLFLQILDEGFLNDSRGMRTDFRNTIIIATSNAGALFIRDFVREHQNFDKDNFKTALVETILRDRLFAPEFVNRFDEIVLYYPLSQEGAAEVATLMLDDIINDIQKRRGISVSVEQDVIGGLVERGYSIEFGAREMRRTITEMIEDYLADYMLNHDVRRGEEIVIRKGDLKW
jgi:ATP-dependent Clp protease ATP-binding subunit ClpC